MGTDRNFQKRESLSEKNIGLVKTGLVSAEYLHGYSIKLLFADGLEKEVDFEPYIRKSLAYKKFLEIKNFLTFRLEEYGHSLEWKGNILDFNSSHLRTM